MRKLCLATVSSTCLLLSAAFPCLAQTSQAPSEAKAPTRAELSEKFEHDSFDKTYSLHYLRGINEQSEALTAIRNLVDPRTKVFMAASSGVIAVHAPEAQQAQIAKLLSALDHPHGRYRLNYTMSEMDGSRQVGVQHFSLIVVSGNRAQLKQGSRIPLLSAPTAADAKAGATAPVTTYIDIGVSIDSSFDETLDGGGTLRSRVEQSSIAPDTGGNGGNPVIRQTLVEGTVTLAPGKSQRVGSLDVPGSTRHFDVDVVLEPAS